MDRKVAFFVDGGFYIQRLKFYHRKFYSSQTLTDDVVLRVLNRITSSHQRNLRRSELYRIYYYDAPPLDKQILEPVPRQGHQGLTHHKFNKTEEYSFRISLQEKLKQTRKLALRMGELSKTTRWVLNDEILKELLKGNIQVEELLPENFHIDVKQKGVDTRIGIDITSVTLSKLVDTIVLVAGDADFVPVAKLARSHGVDVNLDPLYSNVSESLANHIDGKKSFDIVSCLKEAYGGVEPDIKPSWW